MVGDEPTPEQLAVADCIDRVMREHGFLYVENLGVSAEVVRGALQGSRDLFAMSAEEKCKKLAIRTVQKNLGFTPMGREAVNARREPDIAENFIVKTPQSFVNELGGAPASFQSSSLELWAACEAAARRFHMACALALNLPLEDLDFFSRAHVGNEQSILRFNHYPSCEYMAGATDGESARSSIRIGEHADFGTFTFLFLDGAAPGLQVWTTPQDDGQLGEPAWCSVGGRGPGCAIVNVGKMLARWTNDQWRATLHRVVVPSEVEAAMHRYSVAFFSQADAATMLEAHPSFIRDGEDPVYSPIRADEFLISLLEKLEAAKASDLWDAARAGA